MYGTGASRTMALMALPDLHPRKSAQSKRCVLSTAPAAHSCDSAVIPGLLSWYVSVKRTAGWPACVEEHRFWDWDWTPLATMCIALACSYRWSDR